jgi:hypothetical protein
VGSILHLYSVVIRIEQRAFNRIYLRVMYHLFGRAMAEAVSSWPLTAEARIRARVSPCDICGGQSGTGTGFSPSYSALPCQYHSTIAPYTSVTPHKVCDSSDQAAHYCTLGPKLGTSSVTRQLAGTEEKYYFI